MKYVDPDGRAVGALIGAAVGAAVSGDCEVFNQVVFEGKGLDNIDMRKVGIAAAGGALSGAIAGTGIGLVGQIAINSSISAAQNAGNQAINISDGVQENFDFTSLAVDTSLGAISGYAGGAGTNSNKIIDNAANQLQNKVSKEIKYKGLVDGLSSNTTTKAFKNFEKNTIMTFAKITDVGDSVILTNAQNAMKATGEYILNKKRGACNE